MHPPLKPHPPCPLCLRRNRDRWWLRNPDKLPRSYRKAPHLRCPHCRQRSRSPDLNHSIPMRVSPVPQTELRNTSQGRQTRHQDLRPNITFPNSNSTILWAKQYPYIHKDKHPSELTEVYPRAQLRKPSGVRHNSLPMSPVNNLFLTQHTSNPMAGFPNPLSHHPTLPHIMVLPRQSRRPSRHHDPNPNKWISSPRHLKSSCPRLHPQARRRPFHPTPRKTRSCTRCPKRSPKPSKPTSRSPNPPHTPCSPSLTLSTPQ